MRALLGLACAVLSGACLSAPPESVPEAADDASVEQVGCPAGFTRRARVEFSRPAVSALIGPVEDVPVQVVIDGEQAQSLALAGDLRDLRVLGPDGESLEMQLEASGDGRSHVWVRIPRIDSDARAIWIVGGNPDATPAAEVEGVWDAFYRGVWHLDEPPEGIHEDSTPFLHHAYSGPDLGENDDGPLGSTIDLDGGQTGFEVEGDPTTAFTTAVTVEAVVRSKSQLLTDRYAIYAPSVRLSIERESLGKPELLLASLESGGGTYSSTAGVTSIGSTWHYVVGTFGPDRAARVYVDGVLETKLDQEFGELYPSQAAFYLGTYFAGQIDELRLSNVVRSADYVAVQDHVVRGTLVTVGDVEDCP